MSFANVLREAVGLPRVAVGTSEHEPVIPIAGPQEHLLLGLAASVNTEDGDGPGVEVHDTPTA
jgi:hypothetical protein